MGFDGKHHSERTKLKLSGKNSPNWKNGLMNNEEFLRQEYVIEKKSIKKIAQDLTCNVKSIRKRMRLFGIPICSQEEMNKKRSCSMQGIHKGKDNPMYGVVSPFKGMILTEEQKKEYGNKVREYYETHDSPFKGKTHSEETIIVLKKIAKERFAIPENNPNWQGGLSFELYPSDFNQQLKDRIRVRDNFICQKCGVPELECDRRLDIHHIDYDKKNCEDKNLLSLCRKCNLIVNFNREYWMGYFQAKIELELSRR